jgi:hypothetical protein
MKTKKLTRAGAIACAEAHEANSRQIAKNRESEFDDNQSKLEWEIGQHYRQLASLLPLTHKGNCKNPAHAGK